MGKFKPVTANGETHTLQEWADIFGVTYGWIVILNNKGELVQRIEDGSLGERKLPDPTGQTLGRIEVIERVENSNRGYKAYRVRDMVTGHEAVVEGAKLLNGSFTGKSLFHKIRSKDIPDTKLGTVFRDHFRNSEEFDSWEDFESWAYESGYYDGAYPNPKDKDRGYVKDNIIWGRNGKHFEFNGKTLTQTEWAKELNISRQRVSQLIQSGRFEQYLKGEQRTKDPAPPDGSIGRLLDRERNGRSIKEFADELGIPVQRIYAIRRGTVRPQTDEINKIVDKTNLTMEELLRINGKESYMKTDSLKLAYIMSLIEDGQTISKIGDKYCVSGDMQRFTVSRYSNPTQVMAFIGETMLKGSETKSVLVLTAQDIEQTAAVIKEYLEVRNLTLPENIVITVFDGQNKVNVA